MKITFRFSVIALGAAAIVALAPPTAAWAHEEITPAAITVGVPTFLTLTAANEGKVNLVKVGVQPPAGVPLGATTRTPPGWAVTDASAKAVTWAATGPGTIPDAFETWGFETDGADQPGPAAFRVTLTFADATVTIVEVGVTVNAAPAAARALSRRGDPDGTATAGLVAAVAALALAVLALTVAVRRRTGDPGAPTNTADVDW